MPRTSSGPSPRAPLLFQQHFQALVEHSERVYLAVCSASSHRQFSSFGLVDVENIELQISEAHVGTDAGRWLVWTMAVYRLYQ